MTDSFHRSLDRALASDDDLPGMWSHADFEGGDPDERSYAERGWAPGPVSRYVEQVNEAVRDLVALTLPEVDPPICRRAVPAEGQE